jgi:hypothetical protein
MKKNTKLKTKTKEDIIVKTPKVEVPKEEITKVIETLSATVPEEEEIETLSATVPEEITPAVVPEEKEVIVVPIPKVEAATDLSKADDRLFRRTGRC